MKDYFIFEPSLSAIYKSISLLPLALLGPYFLENNTLTLLCNEYVCLSLSLEHLTNCLHVSFPRWVLTKSILRFHL